MRQLENGNLELGVHIADVSHFVPEDAQLDREALERSTSVYLVDRVIPMLTPVLSEQTCSLRPDEDKLCLSCIMEVAGNGTVAKYAIEETIIRSKERLTYRS